MSTLLLTGGAGFVGAHVARALVERGHKVVIFDVASPSGPMADLLAPIHEQVVFERGQILDLPGLMQALTRHHVRGIFHAAALYDPEYSIEQPYLTYRTNIEGTMNVLEAVRLLGLGRVVQSSSIAVYAPKQYEPMDEKHPIFSPTSGNALGHYGASKAAAELVGLTYAGSNGVDFIALRYSAVYGHGMRYPMYIKPMVENSVQGKPTRFTSGGAMPRDYTHVKDVAQAVTLALEVDSSRLGQRVFNVASGTVNTAGQVAEVVRQAIPGADIEIGPGLNPFEQSDIRLRGQLDISAARSQLGYEPHYPLRTGTEDYAEAYTAWLKRKT